MNYNTLDELSFVVVNELDGLPIYATNEIACLADSLGFNSVKLAQVINNRRKLAGTNTASFGLGNVTIHAINRPECCNE